MATRRAGFTLRPLQGMSKEDAESEILRVLSDRVGRSKRRQLTALWTEVLGIHPTMDVRAFPQFVWRAMTSVTASFNPITVEVLAAFTEIYDLVPAFFGKLIFLRHRSYASNFWTCLIIGVVMRMCGCPLRRITWVRELGKTWPDTPLRRPGLLN